MSRNNMTEEEKFKSLYLEMYELCEKNGWGDPFSYARAKEIYMACVLNHKVSPSYSGSDGYDDNGEYEYKSTICDEINAAYNGISVHKTLEEQVEYLRNEKIGKYKKHYCARFVGGQIGELYELDGKIVLDILLPKLISSYKKGNKNKKDPRLGATLTKNEIKRNGKRIV